MMIINAKKDLQGRKKPSCDKAKRPVFIENSVLSPRRLTNRKDACCLFSSVLATFARAIKACPIPKLLPSSNYVRQSIPQLGFYSRILRKLRRSTAISSRFAFGKDFLPHPFSLMDRIPISKERDWNVVSMLCYAVRG